MNKGHFKDSQVVKGITIGAVLIVIYLALNNVTGILDSISYLAGLVMPFIIGAVIAFVFNVPMKAIEKGLNRLFDKRCKKKHPRLIRVLAYMFTLILILAIIAGVLFVVVPELVNTIADLIGQVPTAVNNLINWLQVKLSAYPEYEEKLSSISINWDSVLSNVMNFLSIGTKGIINGGIGAISGFFSGVTNFFIGFVFSVYVLFQKERLTAQCKKLMYVCMPENRADKIIEVLRLTNTTFSNFLSGQCLEACILGTMFVITLSILRMPYALLIGIIIAVSALIPIVGAFIGCIVGVILIMMTSPLKALIFVGVFLILQQIEGNIIAPKVLGEATGLTGFWVIFAIVVFGGTLGFVGLIIGVPAFSVIYTWIKNWITRRLQKKHMPTETVAYSMQGCFRPMTEEEKIAVDKMESERAEEAFRKATKQTLSQRIKKWWKNRKYK